MPTMKKDKYKPCPHCGDYEVLGHNDFSGQMLCMCGENYYPTELEPGGQDGKETEAADGAPGQTAGDSTEG